jgi:hypothetical protein
VKNNIQNPVILVNDSTVSFKPYPSPKQQKKYKNKMHSLQGKVERNEKVGEPW